ncbi:MAG: glutamine synthetase, partial [Chloroflexi bacterium]|nr:glutamine synthetase [Chloroflexota bacterium]
MDIGIEAEHHREGLGQHQLDLQPDHALHMADHTLTVRYAIKTLAQRQGLRATFMPRPLANAPGSSLHIHQYLVDVHTGRNPFADGDDYYGL